MAPLSPNPMPKVSVLMVTYNHERFIAEALDSALAQVTDFPFEIVVGEDCSTDRTRAIVGDYHRRHPETIRPLFHERNVGMNANVLAAYRACRGRYIALLEGDDYWTSPHKLQRQADYLDDHPECATCFHDVAIVDEDGREQAPSYCRLDRNRIFTVADLLRGNLIPGCAALFRADLVPELPDWMRGLPMTDWPLHLLVAEHGTIAYLHERMAAYRIHSGGVWSSVRNDARAWMPDRITMYRRLDEHFGRRYHGDITLMLCKCFYALARAQERGGGADAARTNFREAGACALRCLRAAPSPERLLRLLKIGGHFLVSRFARASARF